MKQSQRKESFWWYANVNPYILDLIEPEENTEIKAAPQEGQKKGEQEIFTEVEATPQALPTPKSLDESRNKSS